MNKNLIFEQNLASDKVAYERPTSQVYELEVEGAILQASGTPSTTNQVFGDSNDSEW